MNVLSDTSTPVERPAPDRIRVAPEIEPGVISAPKEVLGVHLTGLTDEGNKIPERMRWMGRAARAKRRWATLSGSAYETHLRA